MCFGKVNIGLYDVSRVGCFSKFGWLTVIVLIKVLRNFYNIGKSRAKNMSMYLFIYFPNGRYTDCLSLIYATNKNKILDLHYKYYKQLFEWSHPVVY